MTGAHFEILVALHRERPGLHEPRKGYEYRLSVRPGLTFDVLIVFRLCVC
jgi:hypothetical protein